MRKSRKPHLFDQVAVLNPPHGLGLEVGDRGRVTEIVAPGRYEIEFLDDVGRTRCYAILSSADLLTVERQGTLAG
jgi:hypothetical protein